ncbi:MAG: hypothetical protein DRP66_06840 [Planctomycetota bacterium]|nr:MAG: hypothetical protein DRP66_06840 [Planctomycetota bacterium]
MYKLKLAIRYFLRRRITAIAVAAVALCVFIVVVVMTVMNGLVSEFRSKNHNFVGDCVISTDSLVGFPYYAEFIAELDKQQFVAATSGVIRSYGLLTQPGADWNLGIEIMGINAADHIGATGFAKTLHYHKFDPENAFIPAYNPALVGCVVGIDLMPSSRDRSGEYYHSQNPPRYELIISCFPLTPKGGLARAGTDLVNTLSFFYSDDSQSELVKVDGKMIYVPFEYAQKMCGMSGETPRISAVHVKFTDGAALDENCNKVRQMWRAFVEANKDRRYASLLENVSVQSWIENRRSTIGPMEKEQTMLILLFGMLGIITVFVIFVVFYMIISHKSKDIGILRSIGVPERGVVELFIYFAVIVGAIGAGIGAAAGCGVLVKANDIEGWLFATFKYQVWDRSIYAIGDIPNKIELHVLAVIMLSAVAASVVGALVPAIQAARKRPAEALQVNQL